MKESSEELPLEGAVSDDTPTTFNPESPGSKTSELAATAATFMVSAGVALLALFSPGFTIDPQTQKWAISVATAILGLISTVYVNSRSKVKVQSLKNRQAVAVVEATAVQDQRRAIGSPGVSTGETHAGGQF